MRFGWCKEEMMSQYITVAVVILYEEQKRDD